MNPINNSNEVVIVGTGAMACLFAARLSAGGVPVVMLGSWPAGLQTLAQDGVRLVEADGREMVYSVRVVSDPQDCQEAQFALVLVKSWQTEAAAHRLAACLAPHALALTLQNGLGNYEILARVLGSRRVAQGATTAGATLLGPGKVRAGGEGVITLGVNANLQSPADLFGRAGLVVETIPDIRSAQWGKLVINAAINPLAAILGVPNGALLERPAARSLLQTTAREAAAVAVALGVNLPYPDPVVATEAIAGRTAANIASMLQDVRRGAPTEIDVINGAIVKTGEKMGVPTPVNRTLTLLVRSMLGPAAA